MTEPQPQFMLLTRTLPSRTWQHVFTGTEWECYHKFHRLSPNSWDNNNKVSSQQYRLARVKPDGN